MRLWNQRKYADRFQLVGLRSRIPRLSRGLRPGMCRTGLIHSGDKIEVQNPDRFYKKSVNPGPIATEASQAGLQHTLMLGS
jgi:hypothetical protein